MSNQNAVRQSTDRPGLILLILCAAVFLSGLDLFIVNVALTHIGRSIGESALSDLSWILNAYAIFYAAMLVPAGRMADRLGQKSGFLLGVLLFTLASLGAGLSTSLWMLIVFRCVQATGAAILTPSSLGLLLTVIPLERRQTSIRIWATSGSIAAALGPIVGGLLLELSWHWIFIINLPIGILMLIIGMKVIPAVKQQSHAALPDLLGGGLLVVSIGALSLGLVKGPDWGWTSAATSTSFTVFLCTFIVFVYRSIRHPVPILDLSLFHNRAFAWSNLSAFLHSVVFAMILLSTVLFLQDHLNWSELQIGLGLATGPGMVWPFAIIGQRLAKRLSAGAVAAIGMLLTGIGPLLTMASVSAPYSFAAQIMPGWLLVGIGFGLAIPLVIASATSGLAPNQTATGSAMVNMSRQLGAVLGTSILVVVLATPGAYMHAWWIAAALSAIGAMASLGMARN